MITPSPDPEIPRTQGVGTWRLAQEYLSAAKTLQPTWPKTSFVSYYLYGHGLELTLKAFLVSQGSTLRGLKRVGHDLKRALRAARKHASFAPIVLTDKDRIVVSWLNEYYREKEFEYLVTGAKTLPSPDEVQQVCERLHADVKPLIWAAVNAHIASGAA
jgi:hypothetical protein